MAHTAESVHDYHAKEREILEGQAVYGKDFQKKKAWMSGAVVEKTGPMSAWVQLDNGTVIQWHQNHVRSHEMFTDVYSKLAYLSSREIWTLQIDLTPNVWLHSLLGRASHRITEVTG